MKDNELRAMFADLERKIAASTSAPHAFPEVHDRMFRIEQKLNSITAAPTIEHAEKEASRDALQRSENEATFSRLDDIRRDIPPDFANDYKQFSQAARARLSRIDEIATVLNNNSVDARQRLERIEKAQVPPRMELPSPRIPLTVGMALGAMIFALGVLAGSFLR